MCWSEWNIPAVWSTTWQWMQSFFFPLGTETEPRGFVCSQRHCWATSESACESVFVCPHMHAEKEEPNLERKYGSGVQCEFSITEVNEPQQRDHLHFFWTALFKWNNPQQDSFYYVNKATVRRKQIIVHYI